VKCDHDHVNVNEFEYIIPHSFWSKFWLIARVVELTCELNYSIKWTELNWRSVTIIEWTMKFIYMPDHWSAWH
jgi:hypothetical protein